MRPDRILEWGTVLCNGSEATGTLAAPTKTIIACVYGGGTYPELGDQKFWIEYPPQFPGDAKEWTNDPDEARRQPDDFYYLPQVIMHEFGHTAGLGHTPGGNVMGAIDSRNPIEAPTPYDVDGMRNNYESHTRHEDGVQ